MSIFSQKIGPVFLKEESDASNFISKMESLQREVSGELADSIKKDIMMAKYGLAGENNIAFELKNSGMDMYILHDLYLIEGDLSAQIDYLVITRKRTYIIECKNMIGDIEIDSAGTFIRTYEWNGKKKKEAIYSPITQNERHRMVVKAVRAKEKNAITRLWFEKNFDVNYQSIVVLANPKTCLNAKYAKKEVKEQVIRADQLIAYIKKQDSLVKDSSSKDSMSALAEFFLKSHNENGSDYVKKYEQALQSIKNNESSEPSTDNNEHIKSEDRDTTECIKRLKEFRLQQSRKENIKPFYIFNDAQMQELIEKFPKTGEELKTISGFGDKKVEKYGEQIISILKEILC